MMISKPNQVNGKGGGSGNFAKYSETRNGGPSFVFYNMFPSGTMKHMNLEIQTIITSKITDVFT